MNTAERIARINAHIESENNRKGAEERAKNERIASLLAQVKAFAPRMVELVKVGIVLRENKLALCGYFDNPRQPDFVTNAIDHRVGFIIRNTEPTFCFGIRGGGLCGRDIVFTPEGDLLIDLPWDREDVYHLERFVSEFGDFESRVYAFVDKL